MKKMKTLYVKDENHMATNEIQCEWVFDEGVKAYIKRDGTSCMFKDGQLYKRYDAKRNRKTGEYKQPPEGAIPCCEPDDVTGHWPHWVLCDDSDKWHMKALYNQGVLPNGTYELCGPKINGNKESLKEHVFISHTTERMDPQSYDFNYMKAYIDTLYNEGLVFHHPDGRMCKVRRTDFGFDWPIK